MKATVIGPTSRFAYSVTPSQAQPTATVRSAARRVSMYVRTARRISSARNAAPNTSRTMAGAVPAFGTAGIAFGIAEPDHAEHQHGDEDHALDDDQRPARCPGGAAPAAR